MAFLNFIQMKGKVLTLVFFSLLISCSFFSMQTTAIMPLYEGEIPNTRKTTDQEYSRYEQGNILIVSRVSRPTLTRYLPSEKKATGAAVIICPGGGYVNLAMGYEGEDVALRFNQSGVAAFVLKYRIPDDSTMFHKEIGPLQDAQRAIQLVRLHAREWKIDPGKIGIMGFSAGGHLASTAGTHFQKEYISNPDHVSLRPDFMVLVYPVISFENPIAHKGSSNNLIGPDPSPEKIKEFSNEEQVTSQTPPVFLVHAKDDDAVPYENTTRFAEACNLHHVPAEVYLYEKGGHGFGMNNKTSNRFWMDSCIQWMAKEHFLR
jgi:acetyl esterase/lipase